MAPHLSSSHLHTAPTKRLFSNGNNGANASKLPILLPPPLAAALGDVDAANAPSFNSICQDALLTTHCNDYRRLESALLCELWQSKFYESILSITFAYDCGFSQQQQKNNKIDPNNVQFLSISHDVFQNEYTFAEVLLMNMFKAVFFSLIVKQNPAPGS